MPAPEQGETRQGHYVRANGLDIYYEERGRGLPLLLNPRRRPHRGLLAAVSRRPGQ